MADLRTIDIYTILAAGGSITRLTGDTALDWAPAWSPDGTKISYTFARYRRGVEDIVVLDLQTSEAVRIMIPNKSELEPNWQPR